MNGSNENQRRLSSLDNEPTNSIDYEPHLIILLGDSDISRWPARLYPFRRTECVTNLSEDGASMKDTLGMAQKAIRSIHQNKNRSVLILACAGENDLCAGHSVEDILLSFRGLLGVILSENHDDSDHKGRTRLVFLGPKIEPWMSEDSLGQQRVAYVRLNEGMKRECRHWKGVLYVDSLTLFCGDSGRVPGATWGGKARAEREYFENDNLHLNAKGYELWKNVINHQLPFFIPNKSV